jgi:biopolymer transport protein TolR
MLRRLQLRVRNRRLGRKRYTVLSSVNSSVFAQSMLGCALVLLIVFMMYAPSHHGLAFDRYISHHLTSMPAAIREDAMRVMLSRDGTIYFGNAKVTSEDLAEQIRQRLESGAQHKVFLILDQRAKFGDLSVVLDEVRHAGIWDIAFLAEFPVMHK